VKKRVLWQLYPSYLVLIFVILVSTFFYVSIELKDFLTQRVQSDIEIRAKILREIYFDSVNNQNETQINALCKKFDNLSNARITIISITGKVLGESAKDPALEDNHADRPEVIEAYKGNKGSSIRYSKTLGTNMIYVALPIKDGDKIIGIIRIAKPLNLIDKILFDMYLKILLTCLFLALIAGLFSFFIAKKMRRLENVRKDFVANVSHELRTPITSIKGFTETLLEGDLKDKKEVKHFLEIIKKHSDRLNLIIEDLLCLSKIERIGKNSEIMTEQCNLGEIINNSVEACLSNAAEKNLEIEIIESRNLEMELNSFLIEQALVNLIDNAIKYSETQGKIIVKACEENKNIVISVQDFGCGIDEKHLKRLFERFYRVDKARSRKQGGTGLGLAIVKHIAEVHGGFVTVESRLGKGSTFFFYLPNSQ